MGTAGPLGARLGVNTSLLGPPQEYLSCDPLDIRHTTGFLPLPTPFVGCQLTKLMKRLLLTWPLYSLIFCSISA